MLTAYYRDVDILADAVRPASLDYSRRVPRQAQAIDCAELRRRRRFHGVLCNEILGSAISVELARIGTTRRIIRANFRQVFGSGIYVPRDQSRTIVYANAQVGTFAVAWSARCGLGFRRRRWSDHRPEGSSARVILSSAGLCATGFQYATLMCALCSGGKRRRTYV